MKVGSGGYISTIRHNQAGCPDNSKRQWHSVSSMCIESIAAIARTEVGIVVCRPGHAEIRVQGAPPPIIVTLALRGPDTAISCYPLVLIRDRNDIVVIIAPDNVSCTRSSAARRACNCPGGALMTFTGIQDESPNPVDRVPTGLLQPSVVGFKTVSGRTE